MTYEEIFDQLEEMQRFMTTHRHLFTKEQIETNGMLILAVESKVEKPPVNNRCPNCGSDNIEIHQAGGYNLTRWAHCPDCGQTINWR